MKKRILSFALAFVMLFGTIGGAVSAQAADPQVEDKGDAIVLTALNYVITIEKVGFRYSFAKPDGTPIVGAHSQSGISFGRSGAVPSSVVSTVYKGFAAGVASFEVTNAKGDKAAVRIHLFDTYARYEILPIEPEKPGARMVEEIVQLGGDTNTALIVKGTGHKTDATVYKLADGKVAGGDYTVEAKVKLPTGATTTAGIYAHFNGPKAFHLLFIKPGAVFLKRLYADNTPAEEFKPQTPVDIQADTWYTLKLVCEGNTLKGYVNGQLVVQGTDTKATAAHLTGTAGIRVDKVDAYIDDFKVASNDGNTIYYENDFETGGLEKFKQDFTWAMGSEQLALDGAPLPVVNKYLQLTGSPTAFAVTGEANWSGYEVSAATSFGMGDELTSNSLLFGYQDHQNHYGFRFGANETISLYKVVGGTETVLQSVTMPYNFEKTYTLKASMKGGVLKCFVDGAEKLTANDNTFTAGKAGILTKDTTSKTDNFEVADASGTLYRTDFNDGRLDAWTTTGKAVVTDGTETPGPEPEPDPTIPYYTIDARLAGGIEHLYGLGDYGAHSNTGLGVRETSNVAGVDRLNGGTFTNQNSTARFISNFTVAPELGFAQVLFETDDKRVSYTADQTLLGAYKTSKVDGLYYFFGDMEQIYGDYKAVRNAAGYVDTKPHYEMFGLGWEAFGALGWNAYQSSVQSTLTDYLNSGYNLTWGVIGSGFWKGDRKALEGTTTSFGMWDDTAAPGGRTDGLPNPRFPDPAGLKQFFKDNNMKLLLGLRNHLKLPASYKGVSYGGKWDETVDGRFVFEAIDKGYFLKNDDGSLYAVNAKYPTGGIEPRGPVLVLDAENPEAVKWFSDNADLWGADGFKEDCMMLQTTHHDDNWNKLMQYMAEEKDNVSIVRNASYCLPGDVLRINDANYGVSNSSFNNSPDRMVINSLAYAASGQSNVYPDIIGGTGANINDPNHQNYIVRNAYFAALCPSQSVGINVLKMNDEARKAAAFKAINWHSTYAPYIYDAALKSYETGYPTSMTPLYIAHPDDTTTHDMINSNKRMYEWMLGESILAAPLFGTDHVTATSRDVYLPAGKWIQYDTGEVFVGPITLPNREAPIDQLPAFVGGKGVLIGEDMANKGNYFVEVFPIAPKGSVYNYTFVDGTTKSAVATQMDGFNPATLVVTDTTANKTVEYTINETNRAVRFAYEKGHNYELTGGLSEGKPLALNATCGDVFVGDEVAPSLDLTLVLDDFTQVKDLTDYTLTYEPEEAGILALEEGKLMGREAGTARFKVTAAKGDDVITSAWIPVTVKARAIEFSDVAPNARLYCPTFTVRGNLVGVDGAELFLTAGEGAEKAYIATVTAKDSAFLAKFTGVADGDYLLHAQSTPGGAVKMSIPVTVDTAGVVLYDGFDGDSGLNWEKTTTGAATSVNVEKGILSGTAGMSGGATNILVTEGEPVPAGEYTVQTTMTLRGGPNGAGPVFGYEDDKNYFHIRLDKVSGKAELLRFVNGNAEKLQETGMHRATDNCPYVLTAAVNGKRVRLYLDGALVLEKTYDKYVAGKVGFRIWNIAADFNEILVKSGPGETATTTIRYLDTEGQVLAEATTLECLVGGTYQTQAKSINGYILLGTPANATGIMPKAGTEVIYRYRLMVRPTGVTLDKTSVGLSDGTKTIRLSAAVTPGNADNKAVLWVSDDEAVATVDANGLVTAMANGTTSITVTTLDGGHTATCAVTVSNLTPPDPGPEPEPGQTEPKIHAMDEMYQKVYTDTSIQAYGLNYRLYVPAGYEHSQTEKLPLLIYLNGSGSRGTDNVKQLANLSPLITPYIDNADYPCIIIVPQLPETDKWVDIDSGVESYSAGVPESKSAKLLMGLIGELKKAYKVDADRVYLMGQSLGGYGTWDLITRHPNTFAAAIPMCGGGSHAKAAAVKNMPLLVLHGSADPTVTVNGSRKMVAAVKAAGNTFLTYLEYEGVGHYVQRRLFEQPELYRDWLFRQRKGRAPEAPDVSNCYMPKLSLNLNTAAQLDKLTVIGGTAAIAGEALTLIPENADASALALVKETGELVDGILSVHFTMAALTGPGGAGLVLRAQDEKNYVHIRFTKDGLNLLELVDGEVKRYEMVPYTLTGNRITALKAEVRGSTLKVWVDNVRLYDTAIQTPALRTRGAVGLCSSAVPTKADDLIWADAPTIVPPIEEEDDSEPETDPKKTPDGNTKIFTDVAEQDWFSGAVRFVVERKLFEGTNKDTFSPELPMTRAMLVTVLARLDGQDTAAGERWDIVGINWAKENGISDGTGMSDSITREQLAVMLYRYAKAEKTEGNLSTFPDADKVSVYAVEAMDWAVEQGILKGDENGKLNPSATATRAQVATIIQRFVTLLAK